MVNAPRAPRRPVRRLTAPADVWLSGYPNRNERLGLVATSLGRDLNEIVVWRQRTESDLRLERTVRQLRRRRERRHRLAAAVQQLNRDRRCRPARAIGLEPEQ